MKNITAIIGASVLLVLGLAIAQYIDTGRCNVFELSLSITSLLLAGIPYRTAPRRRK